MQSIDFASAKYVNGQFVLTFDDENFNRGGSENETSPSNNFNAYSLTTSSGMLVIMTIAN